MDTSSKESYEAVQQGIRTTKKSIGEPQGLRYSSAHGALWKKRQRIAKYWGFVKRLALWLWSVFYPDSVKRVVRANLDRIQALIDNKTLQTVENVLRNLKEIKEELSILWTYLRGGGKIQAEAEPWLKKVDAAARYMHQKNQALVQKEEAEKTDLKNAIKASREKKTDGGLLLLDLDGVVTTLDDADLKKVVSVKAGDGKLLYRADGVDTAPDHADLKNRKNKDFLFFMSDSFDALKGKLHVGTATNRDVSEDIKRGVQVSHESPRSVSFSAARNPDAESNHMVLLRLNRVLQEWSKTKWLRKKPFHFRSCDMAMVKGGKAMVRDSLPASEELTWHDAVDLEAKLEGIRLFACDTESTDEVPTIEGDEDQPLLTGIGSPSRQELVNVQLLLSRQQKEQSEQDKVLEANAIARCIVNVLKKSSDKSKKASLFTPSPTSKVDKILHLITSMWYYHETVGGNNQFFMFVDDDERIRTNCITLIRAIIELAPALIPPCFSVISILSEQYLQLSAIAIKGSIKDPSGEFLKGKNAVMVREGDIVTFHFGISDSLSPRPESKQTIPAFVGLDTVSVTKAMIAAIQQCGSFSWGKDIVMNHLYCLIPGLEPSTYSNSAQINSLASRGYYTRQQAEAFVVAVTNSSCLKPNIASQQDATHDASDPSLLSEGADNAFKPGG